jgi:type II secretory pathway pseudopilin PulG
MDDMIETLIAIAVAIVAALGWGYTQRRAGAQTEREKQAAREQEARTIADEVDNDVGAMPPTEAREELKRWGR